MSSRTLLLAPPSVAGAPSALEHIAAAHDRTTTDIQMLDRLALGLVSLPPATYDLVLLLTDVNGSRTESQQILDRGVISKIVQALRPGGKLKSQDGTYATQEGSERTEAILAGLVSQGGEGMVKPMSGGAVSVPLRLGKKSNAGPVTVSVVPPGTNENGKRPNVVPNGVGFSDDFMVLDDDELVDEDDLLTEEDKQRPMMPRKSRCSL
jgi:hypothetical protein